MTAAAYDDLTIVARAAAPFIVPHSDAAATAIHHSVTAGACAATTTTFVFPITCAATAVVSVMYTLA